MAPYDIDTTAEFVEDFVIQVQKVWDLDLEIISPEVMLVYLTSSLQPVNDAITEDIVHVFETKNNITKLDFWLHTNTSGYILRSRAIDKLAEIGINAATTETTSEELRIRSLSAISSRGEDVTVMWCFPPCLLEDGDGLGRFEYASAWKSITERIAGNESEIRLHLFYPGLESDFFLKNRKTIAILCGLNFPI